MVLWCLMTAREPAMTPPSTASRNKLRRALERKICSFSSSTLRSRSCSLTFCPPSALGAPVAGAASELPGAEGGVWVGDAAGGEVGDEPAGGGVGDAGGGAAELPLAGAGC